MTSRVSVLGYELKTIIENRDIDQLIFLAGLVLQINETERKKLHPKEYEYLLEIWGYNSNFFDNEMSGDRNLQLFFNFLMDIHCGLIQHWPQLWKMGLLYFADSKRFSERFKDSLDYELFDSVWAFRIGSAFFSSPTHRPIALTKITSTEYCPSVIMTPNIFNHIFDSRRLVLKFGENGVEYLQRTILKVEYFEFIVDF